MHIKLEEIIKQLDINHPLLPFISIMYLFEPNMTLDEFIAFCVVSELRHPTETLATELFTELREHIDMRLVAKELLRRGGPFDVAELSIICSNCDAPFQYDINDGPNWTDDTMAKYAEHIRNYYYQYKQEATQIDPAIDPDELQLGPMAQDIEKVNPAVIEETNTGIKTVDTKKLTMMNTGVIADIARKLQDIDERLKRHGI